MGLCAVIGGSGLYQLHNMKVLAERTVNTPYGEPSGALIEGQISGSNVIFLTRHGVGHRLAPHRINYRANIWALKECGVDAIIAVNAVGGIHAELGPRRVSIPNQIIDYTYAREHTFFDGDDGEVVHVDFSQPYSPRIREALCRASREAGVDAFESGTYGVTQGPRLETAAEINRLERDGCDVVGMTGMPEALLARELSIDYGACTLVVNHAAGRGPSSVITMEEIIANLESGMVSVSALLERAIPILASP